MGCLKLTYKRNNATLKVAYSLYRENQKYCTGSYRYGFNGKENDKETVGTGEGTQDYGMRIYNPSLGKFLSVDPCWKEFADRGPYSFAANCPIRFVDVKGCKPGDPFTINATFGDFSKNYLTYDKGTYHVMLDLSTSQTIIYDTQGPTSNIGFANMSGYKNAWRMSDQIEIFKDNISHTYANARTNDIKGYNYYDLGISDGARNDWNDKRNYILGTEEGKIFRHISSQAYLTLRYGAVLAKAEGDYHERDSKSKGVNRDFDLVNNQIGRDLITNNPGKYNISTAEGVANLLNDVVDLTRKSQGLEPLAEDKKLFYSYLSEVKALVVPAVVTEKK